MQTNQQDQQTLIQKFIDKRLNNYGKIIDNHATDATNQGIPPDHILGQLLKMAHGIINQGGVDIQTGDYRQPSALFGLIKPTASDQLDLQKVSMLQPSNMQTTLNNQVANIQQFENLKNQGLLPQETTARTTAKGGITLGTSSGLMQQNIRREDAKAIAEDMISGNQPADFSRLYGASSMVRAELARRGFNTQKGMSDWLATQTLIKTKNSNQQVNLMTALNSAQNSIPEMKRLNQELERTGFTPINKIIISARMHGINWKSDALNGLNADQVASATQFITQMNLMKDETATAFMRGGVPTDQAFKLANDIFNPIYGARQLDKALDQVNFNFNIRKGAIQGIKPQGINGEVSTVNKGSPSNTVGKYKIVSIS